MISPRIFLRPVAAIVLAAIPAFALAATKLAVIPYAPLYDSIPRATGERFSGYLIDSLKNNDAVEMVDLPGESASNKGAASIHAASPDQKTAVLNALEDTTKGKELLKHRNVKPALDAFARAIEAMEKNGSALEDSGALVDAHIKHAVCLYFMGREDEAQKVDFPAALRLKPDLTLQKGGGDDQYGARFVDQFEGVRKQLIAGGSGDLRIDTAPPNAKLWVDNREAAFSPVLVRGLIPGTHYVTIKLPSADPYVQIIEVAKGGTAKISPDAGEKSTKGGPVSQLLDTLGKNELNDTVMKELKNLADKSGAQVVVFGGAYAAGKDMGISSFVYSAKTNEVVELSKVTTDRDLLGVTVDIDRLAGQVLDRIHTPGTAIKPPRPVAADAKPGEEQVNEVDFSTLIALKPVEKKETGPRGPIGGPMGPVNAGDRKPVHGPIVAPGASEPGAAAPAAATGAVVAAAEAAPAAPPPAQETVRATSSGRVLVTAGGAAPPPPPAAAPAPAPTPEAAPAAEEPPAETAEGEEPKAAAPKADEKFKGAAPATTIEQDTEEWKITHGTTNPDAEVKKSSGGGLTSNWWFWPAVGVLAAGAATGAVVAASSGKSGNPNEITPHINF